MHSSDNEITAKTLDTLMQDTWLLALAIRNKQPVTVDDALYQRCFDMIQQVQDQLAAAGAPEYLIEEIKFAHSVFLDEAVMTQPDTDVSTWWRRTPLQGHFLGHIHGGEHFYEHIKKLLREQVPSEARVSCYYRMLRFGYAGKYRTEGDDERLSLMRQLKTLLPEHSAPLNAPVLIRRSRHKTPFWQRWPWLICSGVFIAIVIATIIINGHLHYLAGKWYIPG